MDKVVESYKNKIKVVKNEMMKEISPSKKARLNKYKQKLEIEWRNYTREKNK